jgi:acetyl esterase/lipase
MLKITREYADGLTRKGVRKLEADIFLPEGDGPFDLLVWMHSGGFHAGSRTHRNHEGIAAEFCTHGIATAFIDYRLARPKAILKASTAAQLDLLVEEAEISNEEMTERFYGARPLAAVEDCCAFLRMVTDWKKEFRLSGRYMLGGSSAGAISVLNVLYLPRKLNLFRPEIATVFAFSGGFAYPPSVYPTGTRIMALHNATDEKVPISSIRRLVLTTPDPILLIESETSKHGDLRLVPEEALQVAVARCVAFHRAPDIHSFEKSLDIFPGYEVARG